MHATGSAMLDLARDLREADLRAAGEARAGTGNVGQRRVAATPGNVRRSLRGLSAAVVSVAMLAAALTVLVPSVLASTRHTLTIVKDCSGTMTGRPGEYCTVTASNVPAIPVGSKVVYSGPVIASSVFLSSNVTIRAGGGNTATGYCMVDLGTGVGMCTFWKGTGALAGFHAVIHGSYVSATAYDWDGFYYTNGQ
jgi:hypothetical protein